MKWNGKKVLLYGSFRQCERFFLQFQDYMDIAGIITDRREEYEKNKDRMLLPVLYNDKKLIYERGQNYIISCAGNKAQRDSYDYALESEGLLYEEDYADAMFCAAYYARMLQTGWDEREIWIFGAGNNGRKFYERHADSGWKIGGFLSNYEGEASFCGLNVERPEKISEKKCPYIVICSDAYKVMGCQLRQMGYKGVKDFCFPEYAPKEVFVSVGACQISQSVETLYRNRRFMARYHVLEIFDSVYLPAGAAEKMRLRAYGEVCDAVFCGAEGVGSKEVPELHGKIIERYYAGARKIRMPFYYFRGQFMQAGETINPYCVMLRGVTPAKSLWFRGDREVQRLVEEGKDADVIAELVSDEDYWEKEAVLENFQREFHKIRVLDRFSSIKIADFVLDHYREFPLFRDGVHLGKELRVYIADCLADILGVTGFYEEERKIVMAEMDFDNFMPVYPCVARTLGLEFGGNEQEYQYIHGNLAADYVDFREYIRRCADYVSCMRSIYTDLGAVFF